MKTLGPSIVAVVVVTIASLAVAQDDHGSSIKKAPVNGHVASPFAPITPDAEMSTQAAELTESSVGRSYRGRQESRLKRAQVPEEGLMSMSDEELIAWICDNTDFAFRALGVSSTPSGGDHYTEAASYTAQSFNTVTALLDRPSAVAALVKAMDGLDKDSVLSDLRGEGVFKSRFLTLLTLMFAKLKKASPQERLAMFNAVLNQYEGVVQTGKPGGGVFGNAGCFLEVVMGDADFAPYKRWKDSIRAASAKGEDSASAWVMDYLKVCKEFATWSATSR